ncbi:hypothetical protein [Klebsiella grimontii]|uniref:hypothetical protein n=1 Tax=Klebsiella grimontii TaxID=2058152 RepID=UPI0012B70D5B|nr:hypothetical protein [Klebsiella grimontii]
MADYYSLSAFVINATPVQSAVLLEAMNELFEPDDNFIAKLTSSTNTEGLSEMERIVRHCVLNHPDRTVEEVIEDCDWSFDGEICSEGFLVHSDCGNFNSEHAALFAQASLIAFERNELIEFQISHTSDNFRRIDGYGGAACVVSREFIRWTGNHAFLEAERTAFKENMHYYFCSFTEVHGELEYPESFILRCPANVNAALRFDDILLNYRTGGEKDINGVINFVSGSSIKKSTLKTLTPEEYQVLKQFLTVI